jgi:predicted nucleic acid-binding protein
MRTAFWDSSFLVPLVVWEQRSQRSEQLFAQYDGVTWWGTQVECMSALTRLLRSSGISDTDYLEAKSNIGQIHTGLKIVRPSVAIESLAIANLERFALRAADAL